MSNHKTEIGQLAGDLAGLRTSDGEAADSHAEKDSGCCQVSSATDHGHQSGDIGGDEHIRCMLEEDEEEPELEEGEEGTATGKEDCILFVGDLARAISEADMEKAFSSVGKVVAVDIKRDRQTMRNLGYGFVQMSTREEAEQAKEKMHETEILGRKIRVNWAQRNTALFIGDLDDSVNVDDLKKAFGRCGELCEEETYIRPGKYGRHGYIKYKTRRYAEIARREMNGTKLGSLPIRVVWHHTHSNSTQYSKNSMERMGGPGRPYSVYVQFEAEAHYNVTETILHSLFAPFGEVVGVVLPQGGGTYIEGDRQTRRGYGFVHFAGSLLGRRCAMEAIRSLQGQTVSDIKLSCTMAKKPLSAVRSFSGTPRTLAMRPSLRYLNQTAELNVPFTQRNPLPLSVAQPRPGHLSATTKSGPLGSNTGQLGSYIAPYSMPTETPGSASVATPHGPPRPWPNPQAAHYPVPPPSPFLHGGAPLIAYPYYQQYLPYPYLPYHPYYYSGPPTLAHDRSAQAPSAVSAWSGRSEITPVSSGGRQQPAQAVPHQHQPLQVETHGHPGASYGSALAQGYSSAASSEYLNVELNQPIQSSEGFSG